VDAKEQILNFFDAIKDDKRFTVYHISLYVAIIHYQIEEDWKNPITIYRYQIINKTRMSRRTFNRCMKELVMFGYLNYEPSFHPAKGSKIYVRRL
jgi:hypothetical protein